MALRERNDCTDEGLVPRALAIQSSLRPSSTQRRMSSVNFLSEILWFIPTRAPYFCSGPRRIRPTLDARQGKCIRQTTHLSRTSRRDGVLRSSLARETQYELSCPLWER